MTTIAEIFDISERVHQGDFVLRLTEGANRPEETLRNYVVTPQLVACFDQVPSLIKSAVESNSSKGAYLHGSFRSGKSYFMAVLTLLLQSNPAARSIPELDLGRRMARASCAQPNITWSKNRGKEPMRNQAQFPWFWNDGEFTGERVNDLHLTIAEKRAAREKSLVSSPGSEVVRHLTPDT
jgi:hypothetical protein